MIRAQPTQPKWKKRYVAILDGGPTEPTDYPLAQELVQSGFAAGQPDVSRRPDSFGEIVSFRWEGPTVQGRLFAEQLRREIKKESLLFKLQVGVLSVASWAVGVVTTVILNWATCT